MTESFERHIIKNNYKSEAELYNHFIHVATYNFSLNCAKDKTVLDFGCGTGYGSFILSKSAKHVVATDISNDAIEYAKAKYTAYNLAFKAITELGNEKFDVITSFQVIEHVTDEVKFLEQVTGYLKPNGILLLSTPDRKNRLLIVQKPWNIYHKKEYSEKTITKLLKRYFTDVELFKISSKTELVKKEIFRTRRQMIITLPCSLSIYPDFLRVSLLKSQKVIFNYLRSLNQSIKKPKPGTSEMADISSKHSIDDIEIKHNPEVWTDLLMICFQKVITQDN